ncbi:MAG TPA: HGGxSTG domain-containing protein [Planctomycetota bacterium]|nr:HGGxSTG domain-containing protein [Planctomycetota bacterium]HRR82255.1 HGGxSTG domain-containing protein [Planctomycetota bacterium]HRT94211.1 HGGxSTG domain-containing protein [Planctomycetota bacterium]
MDSDGQCTARSKRTGERCKRAPTPGKRVCYYHGGASTGPKTKEGKARSSLNNLQHGIFARRILDAEEQERFDAVVERVQKDFALNRSSDVIAVEAMGLAFVRYGRAMKEGNADAAEKLDRIVRAHLKDLKATKVAREGGAPTLKTTPAEWATQLLEDVKAADKAARKGGKRATPGDQEAADADGTQEEPQI